MSGKSSTSIATRSGASAPIIGDPTSTPVASQSSDSRQNSQFVMPETPEQLEELFIRRLAAITLAAQSPSPTPSRLYDPSGINSQYGSHPQPAKIQEVPQTSYRNTTSVSCDTLKANRLTENGNDNAKRSDSQSAQDRRSIDTRGRQANQALCHSGESIGLHPEINNIR